MALPGTQSLHGAKSKACPELGEGASPIPEPGKPANPSRRPYSQGADPHPERTKIGASPKLLIPRSIDPDFPCVELPSMSGECI